MVVVVDEREGEAAVLEKWRVAGACEREISDVFRGASGHSRVVCVRRGFDYRLFENINIILYVLLIRFN